MLLDDLRAARARWMPSQRAPTEVVTATDLRSGYGKPDGEIITRKKVEEAVGRLLASIGGAMRVTPFDDGYLLDHLLHVGIRTSLPHARCAGLHWTFPFTGDEREDIVPASHSRRRPLLNTSRPSSFGCHSSGSARRPYTRVLTRR